MVGHDLGDDGQVGGVIRQRAGAGAAPIAARGEQGRAQQRAGDEKPG